MSNIRIVVADDHHILLDGLNALLQKQKEIDIVGLYDSGLKLFSDIENSRPDVALVDINMPEMSGVELTRKIKASYPYIHVIALSMFDDISHITEMIDAGVSGYLLKNINDKELMGAIKMVVDGKMYFSAEVSEKITNIVVQQQKKASLPAEPKLTDRELEILSLIAQEMSNAEIGRTLFISERTVETHRKNMLRKTNNKTIVGLMKYAMERHLI